MIASDISELILRKKISQKFARRVALYAQRLQRLPRSLGRHPGLLFSPAVQGYRDYTFGARSGPSVQVRHLFHELGHAAQFGPEQFADRVNPQGFVFKMRQMECMGRFYDDPHTMQATERELDAFAHELHLMQACAIKCHVDTFVPYCASTMRLMEDWACVPGGSGKARHAECMLKLRAFYESVTQEQVLDKLEGWLDLTRQSLLDTQNRPYHPEEFRFSGDGSIYSAC